MTCHEELRKYDEARDVLKRTIFFATATSKQLAVMQQRLKVTKATLERCESTKKEATS